MEITLPCFARTAFVILALRQQQATASHSKFGVFTLHDCDIGLKEKMLQIL